MPIQFILAEKIIVNDLSMSSVSLVEKSSVVHTEKKMVVIKKSFQIERHFCMIVLIKVFPVQSLGR